MFQKFMYGVIGVASLATLFLMVAWMEKESNPFELVHFLIIVIAGVGGLVALHGLAERN
jgi:hypothetical protein